MGCALIFFLIINFFNFDILKEFFFTSRSSPFFAEFEINNMKKISRRTPVPNGGGGLT